MNLFFKLKTKFLFYLCFQIFIAFFEFGNYQINYWWFYRIYWVIHQKKKKKLKKKRAKMQSLSENRYTYIYLLNFLHMFFLFYSNCIEKKNSSKLYFKYLMNKIVLCFKFVKIKHRMKIKNENDL